MALDWQTLNREIFDDKLNLDSVRAAPGGDICQSYTLATDSGERFFLKFHSSAALLAAEQRNLELLLPAQIATPRPIDSIPQPGGAALVLEYLAFGGTGDERQLGKELAEMHHRLEPRGRYGLDYDNFIGHTPQTNGWADNWAEFWWHNRLKPQLSMARRNGYQPPVDADRLKAAVSALLQGHRPPASLLHGDLWGGNKNYLADGRPVIFDPASYYGDRETDMAFTRVFGGFSPDFYRGYDDAWPLPENWQKREPVYNLYHILNHLNLFGMGYASSADSLVAEIIGN